MFMLGKAACNNKYTATAASSRQFRVLFVIYLFCPSSSEKEIDTQPRHLLSRSFRHVEKKKKIQSATSHDDDADCFRSCESVKGFFVLSLLDFLSLLRQASCFFYCLSDCPIELTETCVQRKSKVTAGIIRMHRKSVIVIQQNDGK